MPIEELYALFLLLDTLSGVLMPPN